jgi:CheY-like chemotaxis protein
VKLLVVNDDEMMRICVTAILDALGYEIVEAKDGLEALLIYRARASWAAAQP